MIFLNIKNYNNKYTHESYYAPANMQEFQILPPYHQGTSSPLIQETSSLPCNETARDLECQLLSPDQVNPSKSDLWVQEHQLLSSAFEAVCDMVS